MLSARSLLGKGQIRADHQQADVMEGLAFLGELTGLLEGLARSIGLPTDGQEGSDRALRQVR